MVFNINFRLFVSIFLIFHASHLFLILNENFTGPSLHLLKPTFALNSIFEFTFMKFCRFVSTGAKFTETFLFPVPLKSVSTSTEVPSEALSDVFSPDSRLPKKLKRFGNALYSPYTVWTIQVPISISHSH